MTSRRTRTPSKPKAPQGAHGIVEDLSALARDARRAADTFKPHEKANKRLSDAANVVGKAWSQGWVGYQSRMYKVDFESVQPGEFFDTNWGWDHHVGESYGEWREYGFDDVIERIVKAAHSPDIDKIENVAQKIGNTFTKVKNSAVATLESRRPCSVV